MLYAIAKQLVLPPGVIIVLLAAGLVLIAFRRRLASAVITLATVLLIALSTPLVATALRSTVEIAPDPAIATAAGRAKRAIVVLGAGNELGATEYGRPSPEDLALERLRYAAYLHRRTGWPIIVTGGSLSGQGPDAAEIMADALDIDYGIVIAARDDRARDTLENARLTAPLLQGLGADQAVVVTHAWHMRRALIAFRAAGITAVPAATLAASRPPELLQALLPSAEALQDSRHALSEWLGIVWYCLSYRACPG